MPDQQPPAIRQLFAYPFRIFFLSLAILALLAIPLWLLLVTGKTSLPLALPGLLWHQHEMLFGFLSAAIAGFLLTAVCVWTQTERTHGWRLALLWGVWLLGRLTMAFGAELPLGLVQAINLAFLPLVMVDAGWRIWRARQQRQLMILVVLGLLWLMQFGFISQHHPVFIQGALLLTLTLISIIGGRITPAFSKGWLKQQGRNPEAIRSWPLLDLAVIINLLLVLVTVLLESHSGLLGALAASAAVLTLVRMIGWRGWLVRAEPLLWILHLSILWVPVSLALLAAQSFLHWPATVWSHAAGAGAMASLILGVIARVALGHTGRPLRLPRGMVLAFIAIHLAALIRVLTAAGLLPWHPGIGLATVLWTLAFALFLFRYGGILARPRPDGRSG